MTSARVDALLDAAETEFADVGFDAASLRRIMRSAGTDPGAIHYHFGSREALAEAVLQRLLAPLNQRRLELLQEVLASGPESVAVLVEALVRPDVEAAQTLEMRCPGRARLIGAIYLHPGRFVTEKVASHFAPVARVFLPPLQGALPHLSPEVIAWRVRWCVFGTIGAVLADENEPLQRPIDDLIADLVRTLSGALAA